MGTTIDVKDAIKSFSELAKGLSPKEIAKATARAINRTLNKGRTVARKAVKDEYNIPQKNLTGIDYYKATASKLEGSLYASAKPLPLSLFSPRFESQSRTITNTKKGVQKVKDRSRKRKDPSKGVSVEIHKGQRESVPFAFMIPGAKPQVFARGMYKAGGSFGLQLRDKRVNKEGNDIPIKPLISVTVHGAVINPVSMGKISARITDEYPKELEHELTARISGSIPAK